VPAILGRACLFISVSQREVVEIRSLLLGSCGGGRVWLMVQETKRNLGVFLYVRVSEGIRLGVL
jgi:hypothetical protein